MTVQDNVVSHADFASPVTTTGNRTACETGRNSRLPLSSGQRQLWFLSQLAPDSPEYLVPLTLRLRGALDEQVLRRAWSELVRRHEILRTRYEASGGEPVQVIDPPCPPVWTVVDLTHLPAGEREPEAIRLAEQETLRPFDLERDHPLRVTLLRTGEVEHLLVAVFHHIASDQMSQQILFVELGALYLAFLEGKPSPLPEPRMRYADYAAGQRERWTEEAMEPHLAYWRHQLAGLPRLELPTDRPRPVTRGWRGAAVPVRVPAETARTLRSLAADNQVTLFMTLLTAFQCLLARYTDTDDIPVGTVVSQRDDPELARLCGYLLDTLVMRLRLDGSSSFRELLARNQGTVLDAFDHQMVPFARLVDELEPERDMSFTPLFQVAFTMHEAPLPEVELAGLRIEHFPLDWRVGRFDLALQMAQLADGTVGGQLEYSTDLFLPETARRIAAHFARLLTAVAENPDADIHELDFLLPEERQPLFDPPCARDELDRGLHELFAEHAVRTPDAVAVVSEDTRLTYAELNTGANRLAHYLRGLGAGAETLVGVLLDRDDTLVSALLGVTKSGAAYLPLDPAYPPGRLRFMIEDSEVGIVVTTARHRTLLREIHGGALVVLDGDAGPLIAAAPAHDPEPVSGPENLAYVIYTSGSTGRPKGVCVTHGNVLRLFRSFARRFPVGAEDAWAMFHSHTFDLSVWEMWGALLYGGRLVVVPFSVSRSPEDFLDLLIRERVSILTQTPSAFRGLVGFAASDDQRLARLALRAVVLAGERLDVAELAPWVLRFGLADPVLINMYGITETTVHVTFHRIAQEDLEPRAGSPIGYPLDDMRILLLDSHGKPVPLGAVGEIYVEGPGVARGYLNRPELTQQRFVPNPFGGPGERLYRSGDLARRLPDGRLRFVGRIDDQIKLRGFRIDPGEITSALSEHPDVREAVVVPRVDGTGTKRLVAYLVAAGPARPDPAELRALLAATVPEYMIPSAFLTLEAIPLTANGKIDQPELPAPDDTAVRPRGEIAAARTATEARLVTIWAGVLGLDRIGVHDGFFDLGGDSILAVTLAGTLRDLGFRDVSVRDIFEYRTIARLAKVLDARSVSAAPSRTVAPFTLISDEDRAKLPPGVVDAYPLSQVQAGMVVEMLAKPGSNVYHNTTSFRVLDDEPFSLAALREAARIVVQRHEILRTSLDASTYSVPMQLVHGDAEMPVGMRDLRGLGTAEQTDAIGEFAVAERARRFDVSSAPLLRIFAHVTGDDWWVSLTECHAILEGWSFHSLLMELLSVYRQIRDGETVEEPPRPDVRYADFIAAELEALTSAEDRQYWRDIVERYPKFTIPSGWEDGGPSESYRISLPYQGMLESLREVASRADVSLKSVLHAAYLKVMSALTDERSFFTGLVCDTRPEVLGAERVYGMYLNTVPFPFEGTATTWRELVRQVFDRHVELLPHRRFPLPEIQREAGAGERLLDNLFIHLNFHVVDTDVVEGDTVVDDSAVEFGLEIAARHDEVVLLSHTDVLSKHNGERVLEMYRSVLRAMIGDIDGDSRVSCMPAQERHLVMVEWNRTDRPTGDEGVVERFLARARQAPETVAVSDDERTLTYRELAGRASGVSRRLAGARTGSLVGILDNAGGRFIAAVLGVLGAGCAFLPLDTSMPVVRTGKLLSASGARFLLVGPAFADHAREAAAGLDAEVIVLDDAEDPEREWVAPRGGAHDLAYVMYTSGSTGMPKGALLHHRGLLNHLLAKVEELELSAADTVVQNAPLTFDVWIWQVLAPLIVGGRVRVVGRAEAADPAVLLARVARERIPVLEVVPSLLRAALDDWDAGAPVPDLSCLRRLMSTGESLQPDLCTRWFARFPSVPIINAYGPAECSDDVTHAVIRDGDRLGSVVPIGRPVRNIRLYVLDAHRQPVPIGVPGELYVGGAGVGRGYINNAEKTAQSFAIDPFSTEPGALMYRTGDRVRYRHDGQLEFLGRRDSQVKIRGQRVELGEVEAALRSTPGVRDAVAKVDTDAAGNKRLVGYTVGEATAAEIREHLATQLPGHLIPGALVVLDALFLNRNGKVDREALPAPSRASLFTGDAVAPPRTEMEKRIAEAWGPVLGLDVVGVEDDFFAVGGDSIRSLALVSRLRAAGINLPVALIFEHRTIAGIARHLDGPADGTDEKLIWLTSRDVSPQIVGVHNQSGNAYEFLGLAGRLEADNSAGFGVFTAKASIADHPVDVVDLAGRYVRKMLSEPPAEQFYLMGWCSASPLVWEMGRKLVAQGVPPRALILLDPMADPSPLDNPALDDPALDYLAELFVRQDAGEEGLDQFFWEVLTEIGLPTDPSHREGIRELLPRMRRLATATYGFNFSPASTPVHLILSDELVNVPIAARRYQSLQSYLDRWGELATGGVRHHYISGKHLESASEGKADELAVVVRAVVTE